MEKFLNGKVSPSRGLRGVQATLVMADPATKKDEDAKKAHKGPATKKDEEHVHRRSKK